MHWQQVVRLTLAVLMAIAVLLPPTTVPVSAETGDRTLYLYHTHTRETARITFKHNGVYDQKGLAQLNYFLRDFRTNEVTTMAPQLFDLVWEVYQKVGATQPINIVSAYRSPETNALLHAASSGVAVHSQHMLGHAMDYFIPGIPLTRLRQVGMQQQVGGVGFYPTSGSPFVHMDVGSVRAWPRMTTAQLQQIFPDGKTMHVPADGNLLSNSGYAYAEAQWNQCHAVPCSNSAALVAGSQMMVASANSRALPFQAQIPTPQSAQVLAAKLARANAGGANAGGDDEGDNVAAPAGLAERSVTTIAIAAPIPASRPNGLDVTDIQTASLDAPVFPADSFPVAEPNAGLTAANGALAPIPARKPGALVAATKATPQSAVLAIASIEAPIPAPRVLMSRPETDAVSAYAATGADPEAQRTLRMIIDNETTASITPAQAASAMTASTESPSALGGLQSYVDQHVSGAAPQTLASIPPIKSFATRHTDLIAPALEDSLVQPVAMTSGSFATFVEPDATDLSPATEMGPMVSRSGFHLYVAPPLSATRFQPTNSLLVASR